MHRHEVAACSLHSLGHCRLGTSLEQRIGSDAANEAVLPRQCPRQHGVADVPIECHKTSCSLHPLAVRHTLAWVSAAVFDAICHASLFAISSEEREHI